METQQSVMTQSAPSATLFGSNVGGSSLSISTGADGNLYYLSRASGVQRLYRIRYTPPSIAPTITQHPTPSTVSVGQSASFSVTASGTAPLNYQWQKESMDIPGANQPTFSIASAQLADAGNYRVIVSNSAGSIASSVASLTVTLPNQKPVALISSPAKNTLYTAGTSISFSGSGTDPEQGDLPSSAFSWQINFHHDTHKHDQPAIVGVKQSSFDIPNQGETSANVWYRIILTVKDSQGLEGKDSVDVFPRKSTITLETIPPGLQLTLDGQPLTSPISVVSVQGILRTIGIVNPQAVNNTQYQFDSWSNASAAEQTFATPATNTTYVAKFSVVLSTEDLLAMSSYPNPANDWIYFDKLEIAEVVISDLLGRASYLPVQQNPSGASVSVSHLAAGMYFLDKGKAGRQKIFIHH